MSFRRIVPGLIALFILVAPAAARDLELPPVIADHMVLQREEPVNVWGRANPGQTVRVAFAGQHVATMADDNGRWVVRLRHLEASSTPRQMTISADDESITINDVLVGDVWLCSGQSNMVWTIDGSSRAEEFKAGADEPRIRMFIVPNTAREEPQETTPGQWFVASPQTLGRFSAVAYHFGRNLIDELDIPIGLVNSSWGGSTVEAWIRRPTLDTLDDADPFLEAYDALQEVARMNAEQFTGAEIDEDEWETVELPVLIEDLGHDVDGLMWFRRSVEIPASWVGQDLTLNLGPIDDNDVTYFGGTRVGATNNYRQPRVYTIPAKHVQAGFVTIAVRVEDTGGAGGFNGTAEQLVLHPSGNPADAVSLTGSWRLRFLTSHRSIPQQHRPANLYNGMIHGLRHYGMRGAIWYQGESNAINPRGEEYFTLFPGLIHDWRAALDDHALPFYFVQLPNFTNNEANTPWRYPVVRQAQLETLRSVPHTGMAVTLELGEANDIHPRNKHDVGERLARWALVDTYGVTDLVKSGPIFGSAAFDRASVEVRFDLFGSRLAWRDGRPGGFELAGADGVFHPADARIDGTSVVVSSSVVPTPTAVRYAWENNAMEASLLNSQGLPASPFHAARDDAPTAEQPDTVLIARLGRASGDADGLAALREIFQQRNAGYDIEYIAAHSHVPAAPASRIVFVQEASAGQTTFPAMVDDLHSETGGGDIILLRPGQTLDTKGAIDFLIFTIPSDLPADLPTFIRPDWDDRITDTPGGCATETGAYRRILLTWLEKNGPYILHALNAHRVRIADSFTHYHPLEGGFDEFYFVQMVQPGARLIVSRHTSAIEERAGITSEHTEALLEEIELAVGDLIYIPRGIIHRGVGGVLAQVITIPGFRPGAEIGVDHHLRAINESLGLTGDAALPYNREASTTAVIR